MHLFSGEPEIADPNVSVPEEPVTQQVRTENERLANLENELAALRNEFNDLRQEFNSLRSEFE